MSADKATYKPEIDGLRAIAVLSVIIFHADKSWLPGGFTGVDVFLTISGYLITSILMQGMSAGTFSLGDFYIRRIKRILPAFLLVTTVTVAAGTMLMLPDDLRRLLHSAVWSLFSAANVFFWKDVTHGYFDSSSDQLPLLHLWSLGVEEQFYLLWPGFMTLFLVRAKRPQRLYAATALISVAALAWTQRQLATDADFHQFAYYMLPTRCYELLLGSLLAFALQHDDGTLPRLLSSRPVAEGVSLAGLGLMSYGFVTLNEASLFPGVNALLPCVGAAAVIAGCSRRRSVVGTLLSTKACVYVGLSSYSLYLWHWPLLAGARYFSPEPPFRWIVACLVATATLSFLSYRYVEMPLRHRRGTHRAVLLSYFVAPVMLLTLACFALLRLPTLTDRLFPERLAPMLTELDQATAIYDLDELFCVGGTPPPGMACLPRPTGPADVLLWGDSNAGHFVGMLAAAAAGAGFRFTAAFSPACPPLLDAPQYTQARRRANCIQATTAVQPDLRSARYVFLGGQWLNYFTRGPFRASLTATLDHLRAGGKHVVLLGQVPIHATSDRLCPAKRLRLPWLDCQALATTPDSGDLEVNVYLARLAAASGGGITFLGIRDFFCHGGACSPYATELSPFSLYFDRSHLSTSGAWRLGQALLTPPRLRPAVFDDIAATQGHNASPDYLTWPPWVKGVNIAPQ